MTKQRKYPYQILITDILIILIVILISFFVSKGMFTFHSPFSKSTSFGIYFPLSLTIFTLFGFLCFIEYKFNKLSFKNIFLLLGLLVAINNMVSTLSLPNIIYIDHCDVPYQISSIDKVYSVLYGFIIGLFPFIFTSLFPKKVNNKTYLKIILYVFIIVVSLTILISLIIDKNAYLNIISSKFTDFSKTAGSIFFNKNIFGWFLFVGMTSAISLHTLTKKWYWLIPLILFYIFIIFTFSKSALIVSTILLLVYLIVNLVIIAKKSANNLFLIILTTFFCLTIIAVLITFTVNCQSGFLYSIKKAINTALEQGNATFNSRILIWKCTLNLLKPYQYIFGFGMALVGKAISIAYGHHPDCPEKPATNIVNAHNAFVEILAEGGIIYILIYVAYLIILFYMAIKVFKYNKKFSIMSITYLLLLNILGITGQTIIYGDTINIFFTVWIVVPLASFYHMYYSNKTTNKKIIEDASKVKKIEYKNLFLKFNCKRLILNSKNISRDLNN